MYIDIYIYIYVYISPKMEKSHFYSQDLRRSGHFLQISIVLLHDSPDQQLD